MASDFFRVRDNVQRMIDGGAPTTDIDGYLKTENLTPNRFKQMMESPTGGVGEALTGGVKRNVSSIRTGLGSLFGANEAALAGLERQAKITERPGGSLEEVKRKYRDDGILSAAGEAISQVPGVLAEQAPFIGEMIAGGRAGAMLPVPPQLRPFTALGGAALAPFISQAGSNVERQAVEQLKQGKPLDVSAGKAFATAAPQAALDVVGLELGLGRFLGVGKRALGTEAAEALAREKLIPSIIKGTGKTALAEIPTEVTQQMLERAQAGLSLTDKEAMQEYSAAAYQAGLMSPLGGAARRMEVGDAGRKVQENRDATIANINAERKQRQAYIDQLNAQNEANKVPLGLPNYVGETLITFPDGSTATQAEVDRYIKSLPETEQNAARAKLLGYTPEQADEKARLGLPEARNETLVSFPDGSVGTRAQAEQLIASLPADQQGAMRAQLLGYKPEAVEQVEPEQPPVLGLPQYAGETLITFPDGSTATKQQVEQYIQSLPEQERIAARAKLLGYGQEQVEQVEPEQPPVLGLPKYFGETMVQFPDGSVGTQAQANAYIESLPEEQRNTARAQLLNYKAEPSATLIDETTLTSLVPNLTSRAGIYKRLLQLGNIDSKDKLVKLRGELSKLGDNYAVNETKLKEIEDAYKQTTTKRANVKGANTGAGRKAAGASVPPTGGLGRDTADAGVLTGAELGAVAPSGGSLRESTDGATRESTALNPYQQKLAEKRKLEEQARAEEKAANLKAAKAEQAGIAAENEKGSQRAAKERQLKAAQAKADEAQAKADEAQAKADEELPTVDERANEPDVAEEAFNQAKDVFGAFVRQRVSGVKNITPEEQISSAQAMAALADIMYYIVKKGVKSAGQAISRARRSLGKNAKYVKPEEFQAAYDQAVTRVKETPKQEYVKPEGDLFEQTAEFVPPEVGKQDSMLDMVQNIDVNRITGENLGNFINDARVNVVYSGAGIEDALTKAYEGAVTNALTKEVRADILMSQALSANKIGAESAMDGKVVFDENGVAKVVDDANNLNAVFEKLAALSTKIGADKARHAAQAYLVALRYQSWLAMNKEKDKAIAAAKASKKYDLARKIEKQKKLVTEAQEAAIPAGLKFGEVYSEVKDIATIYEAAKNNEIDMLEQAGYYSADLANDYRNTKGYVPLFRVMDDIEDSAPGAKQYFRGFADIGAEKKATGSSRQVDDVFDNMMTRHMWAVNAAIRNRANRAAANQLGIVNKDGVLIVTDKPVEGAENSSAPVWIAGERKYVQYSDPKFAVGIQGLEPALGPLMSIFAGASKILRMGVTMLPPFQLAMVFHDAPRAALNSGVERPFQLMGKVMSSFATILKDPNDPFVQEMRRLGITGGYGHTAEEVSSKLRRDLGLEANSLMQKALDKAETFAAASDMAQRRAIYMQTMEETGNQVLAMHRALDIINFQKHGASAKVRALTQVIPFMNAYIQGMDVLYKAMSGKGISGKEKRQAQVLFMQTAIKLAALSALYSMLVADDDDYKKLDDREKVRSLIIPGTGIKIPVAPDVAMLVKTIPELGYQYMVRSSTDNPMDATKLFTGISDSFKDGLLGPNLMPQVLRSGIEVAVNKSFMTGNPIVGRGLETLETSQQFTENTSRLARLIGQTGILSPMNADHLMKGYGGTAASLFLYTTDGLVNQVADVKTPATPVYRVPSINAFFYSTQGKGQLNDYYDMKDRSDEVTATLNKYRKYGTPEEAREYAEENKEILSVRSQVNALSNQMKNMREVRKQIVAGDLDASAKRERLDEIDTRIANMVSRIGMIREKAGL